jgi:hypothetical protein
LFSPPYAGSPGIGTWMCVRMMGSLVLLSSMTGGRRHEHRKCSPRRRGLVCRFERYVE